MLYTIIFASNTNDYAQVDSIHEAPMPYRKYPVSMPVYPPTEEPEFEMPPPPMEPELPPKSMPLHNDYGQVAPEESHEK